jgi:hypothetical protein
MLNAFHFILAFFCVSAVRYKVINTHIMILRKYGMHFAYGELVTGGDDFNNDK